MLRRTLPMAATLLAVATMTAAAPAAAQTLRDRLPELFIFGGQSVPLRFLRPVDPANPAAGVRTSDDFVPEAGQANLAVLGFLGNWVTGNVSAIPIGTTSGGASFRFERGVPVRTTLSRGPIFGERGQTLGRGQVVVGANFTGIQFTSVRGTPMNDLRLNFTSRDVASPCATQPVTCPAPVAQSANDIVALNLGIDLNLSVTSAFVTYGLFDRVDVGVVVPLVHTSLVAQSRAEIIPFGTSSGGAATTFIGGTPDRPVLAASSAIAGSKTGLGDVAARVKVRLYDDSRTGVSLLGDMRFPTGDEANLLGAGHLSTRVLGVYSSQFGNFAPNAAVGYLHWDTGPINDAVLATLGFDQLVTPWATFALAVVSEFQVGKSYLQLPEPVVITRPFTRTIRPAEIPSSSSDDALSASIGFKLTIPSGAALVVNTLVPMTRGGPRPDFVWTLGVERNF